MFLAPDAVLSACVLSACVLSACALLAIYLVGAAGCERELEGSAGIDVGSGGLGDPPEEESVYVPVLSELSDGEGIELLGVDAGGDPTAPLDNILSHFSSPYSVILYHLNPLR